MHIEPVTYDNGATGFYALGASRASTAAAPPWAPRHQSIPGQALPSGAFLRPGDRGDPHHPGEKRPAVVLIHEWWGLNDQVRGQAQALAQEGFAVLAVDLYGGQHATDPDRACELMECADPDACVANMRAAVAWLRARPEVAGDRVACLGWCFGGAMSLKLALAQRDLAGCVIYYGVRLETDPATLAGMPPVLGIFGAEDESPTPAYVREFEAALQAAKVPSKIVIFEGAGHAFANATRDDRYRPEQAAAAWRETLEFLREMGNVRR